MTQSIGVIPYYHSVVHSPVVSKILFNEFQAQFNKNTPGQYTMIAKPYLNDGTPEAILDFASMLGGFSSDNAFGLMIAPVTASMTYDNTTAHPNNSVVVILCKDKIDSTNSMCYNQHLQRLGSVDELRQWFKEGLISAENWLIESVSEEVPTTIDWNYNSQEAREFSASMLHEKILS